MNSQQNANSDEVQNLREDIEEALDGAEEVTVSEREDSNLIDIEVEFEEQVIMLPSRAFDQTRFDVNGIVVQDGQLKVSLVRCR